MFADDPANPYHGATYWGRVADTPGAVVIDTAPVNEPTKRLREGYLLCPGFAVTRLNEIYYGDSAAFVAEPINPHPLPLVTLTGHIVFPFPDIPARTGARVEITDLAYWFMKNRTWDGAPVAFHFGSVELDPSGTFKVDLPDFSTDPIVGNDGSFAFTVLGGPNVTAYFLEVPIANRARAIIQRFAPFAFAVPPSAKTMEATFTATRDRRF